MTLLSYFKNKSEELQVGPKMADDPFDSDDPQSGHSSHQ
jgi:hypothetical protein